MIVTPRHNLSTIEAEKQKLKEQIAESEASIARCYDELFAPPVAENRMEYWVNQAGRAAAVYDGVMTGYKLFRRFRLFTGLVGKFKKTTKTKK